MSAAAGSGYVWAVAAQLLGRCGSMLANLVSLALIARALPEAQFGIFVLVTGLVSVLVQVADFGTGPIFAQHAGASAGSRTGARLDGRLDGRFWGSFLAVRTGLGVTATGIGCLVSATFHGPTAGAMLLASLAVVFVAARFFDPLYQVARRPFRSTMTQSIGAVSSIGLTCLVAVVQPTLSGFLLAFLAANALYASSCWFAARDLIAGRPAIDPAELRRIAGLALPLGLAGLMTAVNGRANLLFLEHYRGTDAVAVYGAAARVLDLGVTLATLVLSPVIPVLSSAAHAGVGRLAQDVRRSVSLLLQLTLPLLVATQGLALPVVRILYGARYDAAAPVLTLLAFVGFGVVFSLMASYALLSLRVTRYAIWITGSAVLVNLALNAVLVPRAGVMGAAVAQIGTELVLVSMVTAALVRLVPGAIDGAGTVRMLLAAAAAWVLISMLGPEWRLSASILVAMASAAPLLRLWRQRNDAPESPGFH